MPLIRTKKSRSKLFIIIIITALIIGFSIGFLNPFKYYINPPKVSEPQLDLTYSQIVSLSPYQDKLIQIIDYDNVVIMLDIPAGSVNQNQNVRITPLYHTATSSALTAGVMISPAGIVFNKPVTLAFDFSKTNIKTDAAAKININHPKFSGKAQVLRYDKTNNSLNPTLINRSIETQTYLPSRIITGGVYIYNPDGKYNSFFATESLKQPPRDILNTIESVTTLSFADIKFNSAITTRAQAAIDLVLAKKNPAPAEYYAALVLQRKIHKNSSIFPQSYAADVTQGYLEYMCKLKTLTYDQYITEATTAQMLGYTDIATGCLTSAKNIIAENARKILNDPNATIEEVVRIMHAVQLLGLTELDSALFEKAQSVVVRDANRVLQNPSANQSDIIKAIKLLQFFGAGTPELEQQLWDKYGHSNQIPPRSPPTPLPENDTEIMPNFDMAVIWLTLAKALGIGPESFDAPGIHTWVQKLLNNAILTRAVTRELCPLVGGAGGMSCAEADAKQTYGISQIKIIGAQAERDIGGVQSSGYQEEDFGTHGWTPSSVP
jgi:hypothetical protein